MIKKHYTISISRVFYVGLKDKNALKTLFFIEILYISYSIIFNANKNRFTKFFFYLNVFFINIAA